MKIISNYNNDLYNTTLKIFAVHSLNKIVQQKSHYFIFFIYNNTY